jgi:Ca-activated chloride channel family protein
MRFEDPFFLLGLVPVVLVFLWDRGRRGRRAWAAFSHEGFLPARGWRAAAAPLGSWLLLLGGLGIVIALARPQTGSARIEVKSEGIDIMLALDISGSMRAEDFKPYNRLYVAKDVAREFLRGRSGDRIGLVVFAGGAYTQCPLTLDYGILEELIAAVDFGQVPDGTAVGMGLATAVNRLRERKAKSRVVILLTDGQNNAGDIDPITAAEAARAMGVRVYTIGAGTDGPARIPVDDPVFGRRYVTIDASLDEPALRRIAEITGGRYYRATTAQGLLEIYQEIDRMERTEAETIETVRYEEKGPWVALLAAIALGGGLLAALVLDNRIP